MAAKIEDIGACVFDAYGTLFDVAAAAAQCRDALGDKADVDSIDWVELIPFRETRNYVQRVLENLQVYRLLLAKTETALRLERDLHQ